ncbi:hypothetical protein GWI33_005182 [Rhynchophorus ferrugineus]|uniref:Uncharacterized protein n=1 Tax=Rhynchophorus ferrugineus TaxID=354439 RepID=A0A834MG91_RHYFE|nr:hypothetical protein GWI33_005182 [Rhynchophorus ferrugineus]
MSGPFFPASTRAFTTHPTPNLAAPSSTVAGFLYVLGKGKHIREFYCGPLCRNKNRHLHVFPSDRAGAGFSWRRAFTGSKGRAPTDVIQCNRSRKSDGTALI